MTTWRLRIPKRVGKALAKLPAKDRQRVVDALDGMRSDPFVGDIVRLKGERSTWRRRVGNYRIFYDADPLLLIVDVVAITRRTSTTYR